MPPGYQKKKALTIYIPITYNSPKRYLLLIPPFYQYRLREV